MLRRFVGFIVVAMLVAVAVPAQAGPKEDAMREWQKASNPGPKHELLKDFVGTWKADGKFWMEPGKPAISSTGTSVVKLILGGRFLQEQHSSKMLLGPYQGLGYTGYDNLEKCYVCTWMDTYGTGILTMKTHAGDDPRTMTFTGSFLKPMMGKPTLVRSTSRVLDRRTHTLQWFEKDPGKAWRKVMEITYTRK